MPLPVPLPAAMVIQLTLLIAIHEQPLAAPTDVLAAPPLALKDAAVGVTTALHCVLNEKAFDRELLAAPVGPTAATVDS